MKRSCSIVRYHFIRDTEYTKWPEIKALAISNFTKQLDFFSKYYAFVTIEDCIGAIYHNTDLPENALLLIFDDGYIDHFISVFPILKERRVQGCFFPAAKATIDKKLLAINKLHLILATVNDIDDLIKQIYNYLDEYRLEYKLKNNEYYASCGIEEDRFDSKKINFIKNLLHRELDCRVSRLIVNRLFSKYVTEDESSLARQLYMDRDQIKTMIEAGMYVGSHGYEHFWLPGLSLDMLKKEIDASVDFLKNLGLAADSWTMNYPFGGYDESIITLLKAKGFKAGLTTRLGVAQLTEENAFTLESFDANDFAV